MPRKKAKNTEQLSMDDVLTMTGAVGIGLRDAAAHPDDKPGGTQSSETDPAPAADGGNTGGAQLSAESQTSWTLTPHRIPEQTGVPDGNEPFDMPFESDEEFGLDKLPAPDKINDGDADFDPLEPLPMPRREGEAIRLTLDHPTVPVREPQPTAQPAAPTGERRRKPRNARPGWRMRRLVRRLTVSTARLIDAHHATVQRLFGTAARIKADNRSKTDAAADSSKDTVSLRRLPPLADPRPTGKKASGKHGATPPRDAKAPAIRQTAPKDDGETAAPKATVPKTDAGSAARSRKKRDPLTQLADVLGGMLLLYSLLHLLFFWAAGRCTGTAALLLDGLGDVVPPLVCLFAGSYHVGRPRFRAGSFHGDTSRLRTLYALVIALLAAVGELVSSALRLALPLDTAGTLTPQGWGGWVTVLTVNCILVPVAQELLYRGFLQPLLTDWGERFAVLLTGLLFALAGHSLAAFLPRLALSVLLGMAALRLGGVRATAPLHTLYQLLTALLLYGVHNGDDLTSLGFLLLILAGCFVFGIYGVTLLVKQKLPPPERRRDPRNRPGRAELLLISPLFFAALICGIALMLLQSLAV